MMETVGERRYSLIIACAAVMLGSVLVATPASAGPIEAAIAELDKVKQRPEWIKNGYTKSERSTVRSHFFQCRNVLNRSYRKVRFLSRQQQTSEAFKTYQAKSNALQAYIKALKQVYDKGPTDKQVKAKKPTIAPPRMRRVRKVKRNGVWVVDDSNAAQPEIPAGASGQRIAEALKLLQTIKRNPGWEIATTTKVYRQGFDYVGVPWSYKERPAVQKHYDHGMAVVAKVKPLIEEGHSRAETFQPAYRSTNKLYNETRWYLERINRGLINKPKRTVEGWRKLIRQELDLMRDTGKCTYKNEPWRARVNRLVKETKEYFGPDQAQIMAEVKREVVDPFEAIQIGMAGYTWAELKGMAPKLKKEFPIWPEAPSKTDGVQKVKAFIDGVIAKLRLSSKRHRLYKLVGKNPCGRFMAPETFEALKQWQVYVIKSGARYRIDKAQLWPNLYWDRKMTDLHKSINKKVEQPDITTYIGVVGSIAELYGEYESNKQVISTYPAWAVYYSKDFSEPQPPYPPADVTKPLWTKSGQPTWPKAKILAGMPQRIAVYQGILKKWFEERAEKLIVVVPPEKSKAHRRAGRLARRLAGKGAFATTEVTRQVQEHEQLVRRVSATKGLFRKWKTDALSFEMMWMGKPTTKHPWAHMKSSKKFCPLYRAIGIKYRKGRNVVRGKWLLEEQDEIGHVLCTK